MSDRLTVFTISLLAAGLIATIVITEIVLPAFEAATARIEQVR